MGATITIAGENLIAQKAGLQQPLIVSRFILANVPGLDPTAAVDRTAGKPPASQIVGTFNVTRAGYVNTNQVVYSVMLGSDVGDFDWNYIGLETAENVLLSVAYVPLQQKRKNILPAQIGNNVTRNFLLVFDGAKALTGVSIDASTWQHDFTVRLAGIDERERETSRVTFGRACFFGSSLIASRTGTGTKVKIAPGTAYVEGIRVNLLEEVQLDVAAGAGIWIDVSLQRHLSDVVARWSFTAGADKQDYTDSAGARHYCVKVATVGSDGTLVDARPVEPIDGALVSLFAARNGDYPKLRARGTTKEDVGLGNLPNAISDSPHVQEPNILATSIAVNSAVQIAAQKLAELALSLGTAAKLNAGTDAGNVMKVGAFGLGGPAVDISGQDPTKIVKSGLYMGSDLQNAPDASWWFIDLLWRSDGNCKQVWHSHQSTRLLTRAQVGGQWQGFVEFYNQANLNPATIVPAGAVMSFPTTTAPAGFLKANGATVSRTTYAALFAVIGTQFGAGDGVSTFTLPDLRGEFIRGWSDGRDVDAGRALGSSQGFQNASHTHTASSSAAGEHTHDASSDVAGEHTHTFTKSAGSNNTPGGYVTTANGGGALHVTNPAGAHNHTINIQAAAAHAHNIVVDASGGSETRPRNVALLACIKY
ncbi:phage tail protein [Pseudomonas sp. COR18]|uniref:phage tail-collar fiber domain-containing protein n=1 Tax=Pseudomonas sp. COR18 TaxID=3399680 RepID=UPI003AFF999F